MYNRDTKVKPSPKLLTKLLRLISNRELLEEIQGDLSEEYNEIYRARGKWRAVLFYFIEVVRFSRMYNAERKFQSSNELSMLQNYFKVAIRNLSKHKIYSVINISGLAVGMACAFLIFLFIRVENGYDKFHENGANIYRMQHVYGFIGAPAGPTYVAEYPEVKEYLRVNPWYEKHHIVVNDKNSYYDDLIIADENFFTFFSFPLIHGNPATCLVNIDQVAISRTTAEKYFKDEDPLGKIINVPFLAGISDLSFKISAVFEDIPYHSHLQFDMVLPFGLLKKSPSLSPILNNWENDWLATYVILESNQDGAKLKDDFANLATRYEGAENGGPYDFMPLEDLRLESYNLKNDYAEHGNGNQIKIFVAIAIMILLIGCINFTNLATARAAKRSKEVGIRKTLGAARTQLLYQFFAESVLMTLLAVFLAAFMLVPILPVIQNLAGVNLSLGLNNYVDIIPMVILVVSLTAILAGSYPAVFLSSFQPASILNNTTKSGVTSIWIRRILVVFQFSISAILITGTMVIYDQMNFIKGKDLGFNADNLIRTTYGRSDVLKKKWPLIKAELEALPGVQRALTTAMVPGDNAYYWGYKFEGYTENPTGDGWLGYYMGPEMISELNIDVVLGRTFSEDIPSDSNAFVLNESGWKNAIEKYGNEWENPIGRKIEYYTTNSGAWALDKTGIVIGVISDFHHHSLKRPIEPLVIHNFSGSKIVVKIDKSGLKETTAYMEKNWSRWGSTVPFDYEFVEDRFNAHYESEELFSTVILIFCVLAVFIACLGLYGLAAFTTQQRTKEIGIRKVLGASIRQIFDMLSLDFMKLVVVSIIISVPVAIYALNKWLENFTFRVELQWFHFMLAGITALGIALITVSSHAIKAASSNPVHSLRQE